MDKTAIITDRERNVLLALVAVGIIGGVAGLAWSDRFWAAFLQNSFYFLTLALGGAVFVAVNQVSNSAWFSVIKRVPEAMSSYILVGAVTLLLVYFGRDTLYEWTTVFYSHDGHPMAFKNFWLSTGFFFARMAAFLVIWALLIFAIRRESVQQDKDGDPSHTRKGKIYSAIFLVVFAITFTFAVFDWLMSVEPLFYSTIYAFYNIAGVLLSGTATVTILAIILRRRGILPQLSDKHLHSLGKLVFGFATFWAYIWVSQFLLIYYANIPEETIFFVRRTSAEWSNIFYLNLLLNWLIPFLMLIQRKVKSKENWMLGACGIVLVGHWVDIYVLLFPAFFRDPMIGFVDVALPIGFLGVFLLIFTRSLGSKELIPRRDPYLSEGAWQEP